MVSDIVIDSPAPVPPLAHERPEGGVSFAFESDYTAAGDQPKAITELTEALNIGERDQVLLGVTGSGKTFTIANVISNVQRPALVLAPNKTLAAQLYGEMKSFFPNNAVEYFVSYYDYYQPEAYVPRSDTYIEKDSSINEQIDRMRHSATRSLLERDDGVIVSEFVNHFNQLLRLDEIVDFLLVIAQRMFALDLSQFFQPFFGVAPLG